MFAFEVEYLLGRSFAGDFRDRTESEWPPHPGRLYSALAAAYFENGEDAGERAALEWLEAAGPPHIRAAEAGEAARTQAFVPTNYPGDGPPVERGRQPRYFPAQAPAEATVYFVWPEGGADNGLAASLDSLAARTAYLGKACSLVRMRVIGEPPEPNYAPDHTGETVLRVPSKGRLAELKRLFAADQQVSTGAQQRYRRLDGQQPEEAASEFGQMIVFRRAAGPGLPIEATLRLTEAVRSALMGAAGKGGPIPEVIHGHNGNTHCAVVALPFAGRQHADGHLLGFGVVLPRNAGTDDRRAVLSVCAELVANGLAIPGLGGWTLEESDEGAIQLNLRPWVWTQRSRTWRSVTPILLDRFPKKNGPAVEQIVAGSCRRIGLPDPVRVEHGPYSKIEGVPPVPAFLLQRPGEERPRWGVHATIEFGVPVRGPVLLGAGRYFGLGLMRPDKEERDERR